jgi:hypothetical protein
MAHWLLALLVSGLVLRVISQPLLALAMPGALVWQILLAGAGLAELAGATGIVGLLLLTLAQHSSPAKRPELGAFVAYMLAGLLCFWLALILNAVEGIRLLLMRQSLLGEPVDMVIMQLGLLGFLIPVALGIAARALPLYLGIRPLTARPLWIIFYGYETGLILNLLSFWIDEPNATAVHLRAMAALLMGGALLTFVTVQGILLPLHQTKLVLPAVQTKRGLVPVRPYPVAQGNDRAVYGPVRWLIRTAFGWLTLVALAYCIDGLVELAGGSAPISDDALLHATTAGVVMLLIFGVGQRMFPGFSGSRLRSPHLVTATLWLGTAAACLRVLPVLVEPWLDSFSEGPIWIMPWLRAAFGISGPLAWAALFCFTINIRSVLHTGLPRHSATTGRAVAE